MFENGMTNKEFNNRLENLAKLVENKANNVKEAAQMIRDLKINEEKSSKHFTLSFETENLAMPEIHIEKD